MRFALLSLAFLSVAMAAAAGLDDSPFWAKEIEVVPGKQLMLRPRLIDVVGLKEGYRLVLSLPNGIKPSELKAVNVDEGQRIPPLLLTLPEKTVDGGKRLEISYGPDLSMAVKDAAPALYLVFISNAGKGMGYTPWFRFAGTFKDKKFSREITAPEDAVAVLPVFWKQVHIQSACAGRVDFSHVTITDAVSGEKILDYSPATPTAINFEVNENASRWFVKEKEKPPVIAGRKYLVSCEASGDVAPEKKANGSLSALKAKTYFSRVLVFDTDEDSLKLPAVLGWRVEDAAGKVFKQGELALVPGGEPTPPSKLETSVWVCETSLQGELEPVRALYLEKFKSWGLNRIEAELNEKAEYGEALNSEKLAVDIVEQACDMGFKVRGRSEFFRFHHVGNYLREHPETRALDYEGNVIVQDNDNRIPICPTWLLEGDRFDPSPGSVPGGRDNPVMSYYLDYVKRNFKYNDIDSLFFDFEIGTGPYVKCLPRKDGTRNWRATSCICERCRKAFATHECLDHVPSVKEICDTGLYGKWVDFRCYQNILTWRLWKTAVKEVDADYAFGVYSGFPSDFTKQNYGVDYKTAAATGSIEYVMARINDSDKNAADVLFDQVKNGNARIFLQLQVFAYDDQDFELALYEALPLLKNRVLRLVALCRSRGWAFNGVWGVDDQLIKPLREANGIIAKYEDFFATGEKVDFLVQDASPQKGVALATWIDGKGNTVTFVLNDNPDDKEVTLVKGAVKEKLTVKARDTVVHEWKQL